MTDELTEQQRAWVADLRELASVFEANPSMIPRGTGVHLFLYPEMIKSDSATVEDFVAALGGPLETSPAMESEILRRFGPHRVMVKVPLSRRVEVESVAKTLAPDPAIAAAVAAANT